LVTYHAQIEARLIDDLFLSQLLCDQLDVYVDRLVF